MPRGEELLDTEQVARLLEVTRNNVTAALKAGTMRGEKIDGQWRVPESAVEEYRRDHKGKAGKLPPEKAKARSKKAARTYTERTKARLQAAPVSGFAECPACKDLLRRVDDIEKRLQLMAAALT